MRQRVSPGRPVAGNPLKNDCGVESSDLMRLAWNKVPVVVTDLVGRVFMVSSAIVSMFGWDSEAELVGQPITEFVVPEDRDRAISNITRIFAGEMLGPVEYRAVRKNGGALAVEVSGELIRGDDGMPAGLVLSVREMTERQRAEADLIQERSLLKTLLDNTPDHVYFKDMDGRFIMISKAHAALFGLSDPSQAVGKTDFDFFTEEHARSAFEDEQEIMRTGLPIVGVEEKETRLDGVETWVSTTKMARTDAHGRTLGTLGISRNITDRKQAEVSLELTNRALEGAIDRAEAANQAKSQFLANMSHEIRTPMNGVIGMTGLLLDTELDEDQRRYAETVRASGEFLLTLLNDILDFSKIEAGKLELETLDFDMRALLDDFAALMAVRAQDKGIEFICAAAPEVPAHLSGDPGRLRQILLNLAGNAVKFTQRGEIAVRASVASENDTSVVLRFSVRDTGIGIAADKQDSVFQKFTQADASTTRKYGGTGLGLAISKQLAETMGGEIGLVSEEGHGSEFWFTARFGKQAGMARNAAPPAQIRGVHILVVDDSPTNREILAAQLNAWGARSEETSDGPGALTALIRARDAGDPFAAVILDMQMPGMDGEELARAIKSDKTLAQTVLVLMTSIGRRGDARHMEELGFAAYLVKPARQSDVFDCLATGLAGAAEAQPIRPIVTRHAIREMRRGALRILLAEDNITNQQVALGILAKLGLRADAVEDGAEAIRALESVAYDLVLMDVQMPKMDGLEATGHIRSPRSAVLNHSIPVIAMTAHAMQGDRERCLKAGMNGYVTKPVSPQALAEALAKWLPGEGTARLADAYAGLVAKARAKVEPATAEEPEAPVFDLSGMLARLMDDEDLARSVVHGFIEDVPRQIEALRRYLDAGDAGSAADQAHNLKGASANVGGESLRAAAFQIEKAATAGSIADALARLPELESRFARLKQAMQDFADENRPAPSGKS